MNQSDINAVVIIALAGILATTVMIGVMSVVHYFKLANADMVRAIGSMYTRSYERSLVPGLIIHYFFGLFFAFAYAFLIGIAPVLTPGSTIVILSFAGFVHGLIVGLFLEIRVAEHHPLKQYRNVGLSVVVAHIVGHIFYGLSIGLFFAANMAKIHDPIRKFVQLSIAGEIPSNSKLWLFLFGLPLLVGLYLFYVVITSSAHNKN
jgi:hypothetical protein